MMRLLPVAFIAATISAPLAAQNFRIEHSFTSRGQFGFLGNSGPENRRDRLADFASCVVSRDPAGGLAFAKYSARTRIGAEVRNQLAPVLSACRISAVAPHNSSLGTDYMQRAAVADVLRQRYRPRVS